MSASDEFDMEQSDLKRPSRSDVRKSRAADIRKGSKELPATYFSVRLARVNDFVRGDWFESVVAIIIFLNCATMGIETNGMVVEQAAWLEQGAALCEHIFTVFFLAEFFLRVFFMGWKVYVPGKSPLGIVDALSNIGDACLVWITGVGLVWVVPLLGLDAGNFRIFQMLRAFRLLRLVRIVRTSPAFAEVYMLVRGLIDSIKMLCWTVLIIFFITYIFAIFGVVLISVDVKEMYDEVAGSEKTTAVEVETLQMLVEFTDGVTGWMYTLIQILTLDSWNAFVRPLMAYLQYSWVLIYAYISVAVIVFMNLVTAVIVETALAHSKEDEIKLLALKEAEDKKQWRMFQLLFLMMDEDSSGTLTIEEFRHAFEMDEVATKLKLLNFKEADMQVLFDLLDEGDGCLSLEEFLEGLQSMKGSAQAKDVFMSRKKIEHIWSLLSHFACETDEDNTLLFKSLGKEGSKRKRAGSILQRARERLVVQAAKREKSPKSRSGDVSPQSPTSPVFLKSPKDGSTDLWQSLQDLGSRVDALGANAGKEMQGIAQRLDKVEARNSATLSSLRQFSLRQGHAATPAGMVPAWAFAAAPGSVSRT